MEKWLSEIKKNHQDIHAKVYNDRISKPQQKYRLRTVSKNLTGGCVGLCVGGWGDGGW